MGNPWIELVKQAKQLGSPDGLRASLINEGRKQGAAIGTVVGAAGVAGVAWVVKKVRNNPAKTKHAETAPEQEEDLETVEHPVENQETNGKTQQS